MIRNLVIRIQRLAGVAAGAVAAVGEIVGGGFEYDGAAGAEACHLERIPLEALGKWPGPLGARDGGGEAAYVVDGFGERRGAVERCPGRGVDDAPRRAVRAAALQGEGGDLGGRPVAGFEPFEVMDDRAGEQVRAPTAFMARSLRGYRTSREQTAAISAPIGGQAMVNASQIKQHVEVVGSDGKHVGTVDHMESPSGRSWVRTIDWPPRRA